MRDLVDQGYLAPLVSKAAVTRLDVAGVGTRGGEFIQSQLQAAVDKDPITRRMDVHMPPILARRRIAGYSESLGKIAEER
ncbi:MAG: hypothetical protein ACT4P2_12130 [Pseudomonadota bacterium]